MSVLSVIAEGETLHPLVWPAPAFGIVALAIFFVMGLAMFTYRDVANRHSQKSDKADHSGGHH
jgi:hypothetical protein